MASDQNLSDFISKVLSGLWEIYQAWRPELGQPVLVSREVTEYPETLTAGTSRLVGTHKEDRIGTAAFELLNDPVVYADMSRISTPSGDGGAAHRNRDILRNDWWV